MLKKFVEGLFFGGGFGIAFITVWIAASIFILPLMLDSSYPQARYPEFDQPASDDRMPAPGRVTDRDVPFHDLSVEEQIAEASFIVLAEYEPSADGRMKAIIREFLKQPPDAAFNFDIGEEYSSSSFYPDGKTIQGDGTIIFFIGEPADMQMSVSIANDRVRGLGNMPLELFREKCAAAESGEAGQRR